jgi:preprotein translocase subunit SecY
MFLMWLGEQITARGVGNGISLIIFAGIVAELASCACGTLELGRRARWHLPDHLTIIIRWLSS